VGQAAQKIFGILTFFIKETPAKIKIKELFLSTIFYWAHPGPPGTSGWPKIELTKSQEFEDFL